MVKKTLFIPTMLVGLASAATAFGHATFKPKDNDPAFAERTYKEGTTAYLSLMPTHGCSDADGNRYATKHIFTVLPNAVDLGGRTYSEGEDQRYAGNALMGIKPELDARFEIERISGAVPTYYSHGANSSDVRSLRWRDGYLPDDMYAELKFRATLPLLDGCVERLRVYVPTVQYCEGGHVLAWMREATPAFPEDVITPDYAPYFDVLRDLDTHPLPESCSEPLRIEAYPSAQDIDAYLGQDAGCDQDTPSGGPPAAGGEHGH